MTVAKWLAAGAFALACAASPAAAQTAPPATQMLTTATLAELCGAAPNTSEAPATAFCRGFIIGAGQYSQTVAVARGRTPLYCMPSPGPTHAEFQAAFVAWARANPQYAQERAVEGLSRFTSATYPCPPAQAAARSRTR